MPDLHIALAVIYVGGVCMTFSASLACLLDEMSWRPDPDEVRRFRSALVLSPIWPVAAFFALRHTLRRADDIIAGDPMCLDCRDGNTRACDLWPYPCSERES